MCFSWWRAWGTCLSSCSLLVMDNGASNGFSSFSVSSVVCVFVTAPARGSRNTYFLYLWTHTNPKTRREDFNIICVYNEHLCLFVYVWTHRFSVVLKSNRELTDEMLRGRLPSPSSVSSSDLFLLLTHTGKYINFSWEKDKQTLSEREIWKTSPKSWITHITEAKCPSAQMQARGHTHANTVCNGELYGRGYCFWGILNNAFRHRRKLLAVFSFFLSLSLALSDKYTEAHAQNMHFFFL